MSNPGNNAASAPSGLPRVVIGVLLGLGVLALGAVAYFIGSRYYATAIDLRIKPGMDEAEVRQILYHDTPGAPVVTRTMWQASSGSEGKFDKIMIYQMAHSPAVQVIYTADHKVLDARLAK